jgi:TP901-1 family phage major tail protein
MAAQRGRDILIKAETAAGVWTSIGGLRSKSISLNEGMVDASDGDSPNRWRELLEGAEIRSASISGGGIFKDSVGEGFMRSQWFAGTHPRLQFIIAGMGTLEGKFQITKLDYSGDYNKEAQYSMSFESNGEITFTAS